MKKKFSVTQNGFDTPPFSALHKHFFPSELYKIITNYLQTILFYLQMQMASINVTSVKYLYISFVLFAR